MKIALVHELLTMRGGAERVLKVLADLYPEAPIYTLLYDEKKLGAWFPRERVRTPKLPFPYSLIPSKNHHLFLSAFPRAVEAWDFSEYDVVLSTSSAFVHGIITNSAPKHVCYVHSPARYLWDRTHDVQERASGGILGPLIKNHLSHRFHTLRTWDAEVAARPDVLLAASQEVQRRIELYWRRTSTVVYPPIDDIWFEKPPTPYTLHPTPYYLVVSTLVPYKRIDIAIAACNALNIPLKIAGDGPDHKRLKRLAGPTVEFLGYQTEEALKELYTNATATLFVGEEDFGLVPLESMACGTPVIALRKGGALETVSEKTGAFFVVQTAESLIDTIKKFDPTHYQPKTLQTYAAYFRKDRFVEAIQEQVNAMTNA